MMNDNYIEMIFDDSIKGYKLVLHRSKEPQYEKMSKSRNNSISIDEVLHQARDIDPRYHFVTLPPFYALVDHLEIPVYRNNDGFYYTFKRYGHIPVLLADKRDQYIPRFNGLCNGVQHYDKPEVQSVLED